MVVAEESDEAVVLNRSKPFRWLLAVFVRPARAVREIAAMERGAWLVPMLLLTVLTLANVLIGGPLRLQAAQMNAGELPENFQWMSPEQQQQYLAAQESMNGPAMIYLFPSVGAVVGLWLSWVLLAAVLHLTLTLFGSRSTNTTIYNLAAWASLPFAIRLLVQIIAQLTTRQLISSPGLSGFVAADASQGLLYLRYLLSYVDIYLVWQVVLLLLGAWITSGLTRGKAFSAVLGSVVLLLVLAALPGFATSQFGGMNVSQPFIFF